MEEWKQLSPSQILAKTAVGRDWLKKEKENKELIRIAVEKQKIIDNDYEIAILEYNSSFNLPPRIKKQKQTKVINHHGLTAEQAKDLRSHYGKCFACGSTERLCVDHCHFTERIRGVLCANCNWVLGKIQDNPETLERLIDYLKNPPEQSEDSFYDYSQFYGE